MPAHARCLGRPALSADIQFDFNILAVVVVRKMSLNESAVHAVYPTCICSIFFLEALNFFCSFCLIKKNEKIEPKQSCPPALKKP
jgi:hypothetical protein